MLEVSSIVGTMVVLKSVTAVLSSTMGGIVVVLSSIIEVIVVLGSKIIGVVVVLVVTGLCHPYPW